MSENLTYTLRDHAEHMRNLLAGKTMESVVTVSELLGQAPDDDEKFVLQTRNFIQQHRQLGLRAADIDREIASRRRAARAAKKAAAIASASSPADCDTALYRWIDDCLDAWGVVVTAQGAVLHPEMNAIGALNALVVLNSERSSALAFKDGAIRAGFERVVGNRRLARLDQVKAHIACDQLDIPREHVLTLFADVMRLGLADGSPFTPEEAVQLICKVVWQAKRKMAGLPVTRHLMPVLVGPQGGGKSVLVNAFVSPIEELMVSVDLKTLTDERVISIFENYIGVVDELDKADRANVESLKRIITEKVMDRRPMRSNGSVKVPQNLTFLGTSNRDVAEAIIDETGNRRFVSIPIVAAKTRPEDNLFWDAVNSFAWVNLWRAVDPEAADPTMAIWQKIQTVQASERSLSNIELWLQHCQTGRETRFGRAWISTADLYVRYRGWEELYAPRAETSFGWWGKAFARMSRQNLIPFTARHTSRGNGYDYTGPVVAAAAAGSECVRRASEAAEAVVARGRRGADTGLT